MKGRLKIFLGYAAGVGKTYRMLENAQELKQEGKDVVIGYFEPHARRETIAKTEGLESIPRRKITYRGRDFEEMDTDAVLARHPAICVVDEFAHTNVPGSERAKRWEDVMVLLDAGIDVLATMNVQHIESLNDQVMQFSGIRVRETVPDWLLKQAGEVIMVDVTPEALLNRLKRGVVYDTSKAEQALANFFQESTLVALRELALRQTAHELEVRGEQAVSSPAVADSAGRRERILINVTPEPSTAMLIRRGRRMADYLRADAFAVYVCSRRDLSELPAAEREAVERHLNFANNLRIDARVLKGANAAEALIAFARSRQITQIFLTRAGHGPRPFFLAPSLLSNIVRQAKDMRVTIVAERAGLYTRPS